MNSVSSLSGLRRALMAAGAASVLASVATPVAAQLREAPVALAMGSQPLDAALIEFARVADVQVLYSPELVRGKRANPVSGMLEPGTALRRLVSGTGLEVVATEGRTYSLRQQTSTRGDHAVSLDDIIVTAQRREETLRTVPVAVGYISGGATEDYRAYTIQSLETLSPSVTVNRTGQPSQDGISIRGVGTVSFSAAIEPSVATFVDGVLVGRTAQASALQFADLERIEILRGPQGTLFGKNASAGAVNIITRRPSRQFGGEARVLFGQDGEYRLAASLTGPLSDTLSGRISAFARGQDGHITNTFDGTDLYGLEASGVRAKLLWEPSAEFEAQLTLEYSDLESECCAQSLLSINPLLVPDTFGAEIGRGTREAAVDAPVAADDTQYAATLALSYDLGASILRSITGYRRAEALSVEDIDRTAGDPRDRPGLYRKDTNIVPNEVWQVSQELRLESNAAGPLSYVLGAYLFYQEDDFTNDRILRDFDARVPGCPVGPQVCTRAMTFNADVLFQNYAVFGQVDYDLTDRLTAFLGGRLTRDRVSYDYVRDDFDPAPIRGGDLTLSRSTTATDLSIRTGLEFEVTDDLYVYATYAEGYKGPGFQIATNLNPVNDVALRPETVESYEIGARLALLDNRALASLTAYSADYSDYIINTYDPTILANRLFNAAAVESRGVEAEFLLQPVWGLSLNLGVAYSDTTFASFPNASCFAGQTAAQGCTLNPVTNRSEQELAGKNLARAPEWRVTATGRYERQLGSGPLEGFVQFRYVWNDNFLFDANQDPRNLQESFGILDLAVGVQDNDAGWAARVFVDNVTDQFYLDNASPSANFVSARIPREAERRVGVELTKRFGS